MKVLDLQCSDLHVFEGWFGSEQDFCSQLERGLLSCPICANAVVTKRLSAPRLNLGKVAEPNPSRSKEISPSGAASDPFTQRQLAALAVARQLMAQTEDVGTQFAQEARKIHYGESPERVIRGQASVQEAAELVEEGISVLPLMLPEILKNTLQ